MNEEFSQTDPELEAYKRMHDLLDILQSDTISEQLKNQIMYTLMTQFLKDSSQ